MWGILLPAVATPSAMKRIQLDDSRGLCE